MRRTITVALAALLLLVVGAVAYASIPGPDGVIHACYKTSNPAQGALIAIDSAASCPSGYTALNWNQTGPQGPAGPQGPQGPAGVNGVSGLEIVTHGVQVAGGGQLTDVTVQCPTGKVAIAGGFGMNDANTSVNASLPQQSVNNPGWVIEVRNNNAFAVPVSVQAICVLAG
ncbi:MAG TPA: hypothetical protein VIV12_12935 [Streptosporangiaceae bacterium]